MTDKLKWFVIWYPEMKGWSVMKGGFRDSWYPLKHQASHQRDKLNKQDEL